MLIFLRSRTIGCFADRANRKGVGSGGVSLPHFKNHTISATTSRGTQIGGQTKAREEKHINFVFAGGHLNLKVSASSVSSALNQFLLFQNSGGQLRTLHLGGISAEINFTHEQLARANFHAYS